MDTINTAWHPLTLLADYVLRRTTIDSYAAHLDEPLADVEAALAKARTALTWELVDPHYYDDKRWLIAATAQTTIPAAHIAAAGHEPRELTVHRTIAMSGDGAAIEDAYAAWFPTTDEHRAPTIDEDVANDYSYAMFYDKYTDGRIGYHDAAWTIIREQLAADATALIAEDIADGDPETARTVAYLMRYAPTTAPARTAMRDALHARTAAALQDYADGDPEPLADIVAYLRHLERTLQDLADIEKNNNHDYHATELDTEDIAYILHITR